MRPMPPIWSCPRPGAGEGGAHDGGEGACGAWWLLGKGIGRRQSRPAGGGGGEEGSGCDRRETVGRLGNVRAVGGRGKRSSG